MFKDSMYVGMCMFKCSPGKGYNELYATPNASLLNNNIRLKIALDL